MPSHSAKTRAYPLVASVRTVSQVLENGELFFALDDAAGAVHRFRISVTMAALLSALIQESLAQPAVHSDRSSGNPICAESSPSGSDQV